MPGFIGIQEIVLLVVLLLIIFGAKRLPELGRSLGGGMREFKDGVTGRKRDVTSIDAGAPIVDAFASPARQPTHSGPEAP
jgi:sec-independent protein translocase protein TatA